MKVSIRFAFYLPPLGRKASLRSSLVVGIRKASVGHIYWVVVVQRSNLLACLWFKWNSLRNCNIFNITIIRNVDARQLEGI